MIPKDLAGYVALVLATGVAATVVILALETTLHGGPISEAEGNVLSAVVGTIIGAIAAYLGTKASSSRGPGDG